MQEVDELCREWKPDPLVPIDVEIPEERGYIESAPTPTIIVDGKSLINFSTFNFLGFSNDKNIISECRKVIDELGVGSCGPRGFYGSQKVHLQLEMRSHKFFNTEDSILYSYGFATISSVIPAFLKRNDLIFVDEGCSYPIQHGCELSRAKIFRYRHNDMDDLERLLKDATTGPMKNLHTKQRRYIITEGVFENNGNISPVKRIVELKKKYKVRVILDDSFGAGVLGKTGRGVVEHSGCEMKDFDLIVINLENAFGSVGGLCLGTIQLIRHQRLMGLAFTFSASLPPYTSAAAILSMDELDRTNERLVKLQENVNLMNNQLRNLHPKLRLEHSPGISVFHLRLAETRPQNGTEQWDSKVRNLFNEIEARCFNKGLAVVVPKYTSQEWIAVEPSIRLTVSSEHSKELVLNGIQILRAACNEVL